MSVRAQWHLADLGIGEDDGTDPMADLLNIAKPIDLSRDKAELDARLRTLLKREATVWENTGVECELKWQSDTFCLTCPHFTSDPEAGPMYAICRIGREQAQIADQLHRHREVDELERMALAHMLADECDELSEVFLPSESEALAPA